MLTDDWSPRRWRVALVAHDARKTALVAFVQRHRGHFKNWELLATASTGEVAARRDRPPRPDGAGRPPRR